MLNKDQLDKLSIITGIEEDIISDTKIDLDDEVLLISLLNGDIEDIDSKKVIEVVSKYPLLKDKVKEFNLKIEEIKESIMKDDYTFFDKLNESIIYRFRNTKLGVIMKESKSQKELAHNIINEVSPVNSKVFKVINESFITNSQRELKEEVQPIQPIKPIGASSSTSSDSTIISISDGDNSEENSNDNQENGSEENEEQNFKDLENKFKNSSDDQLKHDLKNMNDEDLDKEIAFIKKLLG